MGYKDKIHPDTEERLVSIAVDHPDVATATSARVYLERCDIPAPQAVK